MKIRLASSVDAADAARLLDDFNREFDTPTPGVGVLARRLGRLLGEPTTFAIVADDPFVGIALVTLRTNVWYDGPVALLDEAYVEPLWRGQGIGTALLTQVEREVLARGGHVMEINVDGEDTDARRYYERHGYRNVEPGNSEPMLYYYRDLTE